MSIGNNSVKGLDYVGEDKCGVPRFASDVVANANSPCAQHDVCHTQCVNEFDPFMKQKLAPQIQLDSGLLTKRPKTTVRFLAETDLDDTASRCQIRSQLPCPRWSGRKGNNSLDSCKSPDDENSVSP